MTTAKTAPAKAPAYENNPFFVAVTGLELLFKKAKSIGIIFAVLAGMSLLGGLPGAFVPPVDEQSTMTQAQIDQQDKQFEDSISSVPVQVWLLIAAVVLLIVLVCVFIGVVFSGIADYTAAQLSHGKEVGFSEAIRGVFSGFWGYVGVQFLVGIKVFLWSLLLIVPGIIMAVRYSLSGAVYFDKKLGANATTKESARLTKGGWITAFASQSLFNLITFGMVEYLVAPGTKAVLYKQYRDYDAKGLVKPKAHVLSWLTLIIPPVFVLVIVMIVIALFALLAAGSVV